jgi:hypothetical protein
MRRRLDRDGEKVLATWLNHYQPTEETRRLILEAIHAFGEDEHQLRFMTTDDISNPENVVIVARGYDLTVHVRIRSGTVFTLVRIIEASGYVKEDDD